jgi:hypothetical protein
MFRLFDFFVVLHEHIVFATRIISFEVANARVQSLRSVVRVRKIRNAFSLFVFQTVGE